MKDSNLQPTEVLSLTESRLSVPDFLPATGFLKICNFLFVLYLFLLLDNKLSVDSILPFTVTGDLFYFFFVPSWESNQGLQPYHILKNYLYKTSLILSYIQPACTERLQLPIYCDKPTNKFVGGRGLEPLNSEET